MSKKLEKLYSEYKKVKGYDDGGKVDPDSALEQAQHNVRIDFGTSAPAPHELSREERNDLIRQQNTSNASGKTSVLDQHIYNPGDMSDGHFKGGEIKKSPHNKKNLEELKKAFSKFITEEESENYSKGGKVKGYADGTEEPVQSDNLTPEQFQQHLQDLKDQGNVVNNVDEDPSIITASPNYDTSKYDPSSEDDIAEKTPEDKALEDQVENEDLAADIKSDKKNPPYKGKEDDSDEESPEEDKADEESDQAPDQDQQPDQSAYSRLLASLNPNKLGSSDALAKAQAQRQNMIASNKDLQLGNLIGAGIASRGGAKVSPLPQSFFDSQDKGAGLPVQNIEEQIANQQNDPNSPVSKVVTDYLTKKGFNLPPGTSAKDAMTIMPFLKSDQQLQVAIQKVLMQNKSKEGIAGANRASREDIAGKGRNAAMERVVAGNQGKIAAAKASQDVKNTNKENDAEIKAENDITNARSKPAIQQAYRNSIAIKNAQKMFQEFPDPDKWTPQQVALYNVEVAKVAGGQAPTEGMIHDLQNPTAASGMANLMQKITNVPTGANQGDFIRLNQKYMNGLADVSNGVIKDNMGNVIKATQDKVGPDKYKNLLYRHSDMLGLYNPQQERGINAVMQAKGLSRQDAIKGLIQQGALKDLNY
jgi:hypothetical protein